MKILQVISGSGVNGALVYCKLLTERLLAQGHEVTLLVRPNSWLASELEGAGIPFLESDMSRFPFAELRRIARWITQNEIDVIHTHMSRGHSFGVLLRMMTAVPVVATAHSRSFQLHWRLNDYVIANSEATRRYHQRVNRVADPKMSTIHCFIDLQKFKDVTPRDVRRVKRQLRLKGDEFLVGMVGDVRPRKGHAYLFEALREVVDAVPNFKLVMLGRFHRNEAYTKQLRQILIDQKLFCYTKWLGLRFNIQDFMSAFDLTVVPSIEEPLGLVAIESLAVGTPVVVTSVGGLPEIVSDQETGLVIPPGDPRSLAKAMIKMAHDQKRRKQLGRAGQQMVFQRFDVDRLTSEVVDIYRHVSRSKQNAA